MSGTENTTAQKKTGFAFGGASLRPVMQLVRPIVKKILPQKSVIFQQIFDIWPDLVASTEAKGTLPEKLTFPRQQQKEGVLSVWALSSAQATEVTYNRMQLIQRLNGVFGYALISDIKVTAHPGMSSFAGKRPILKKTNPGTGLPSQSLDKILGGISNPVLRTTLRELGGMLEPQDHENTQNIHSKGEDNA